ncbi:pantoate--beta-alanine ligase [Vibrio ulleungensis]|uniref:Pantothenate synthetase n=1 Tax=Vibrio ulleungensis TaxID=2807619 RepID=A0ABS2HK33_9VIBR|nr:pantoate--beta-alanine ligase [Vibrio ulleungensis]MBM7037848.1 pantoate--beta-alanine ligase [Vibrio ulleungensis]
MKTFNDVQSIRARINMLKQQGNSVAFVPTMGNLHDGHLSLVSLAKQRADVVVVSIFVNPMQFENASDLDNYPRTLEQDLAKLTSAGVDIVFTPTPEIMYPNGLDQQTFVEVPGLSHILEGESRPGHFRGVATIVAKLFNIVKPDIACFGEKDFQQLAIIRQMVNDLALDIQVLGVPTMRENDGLAMSSRNNRLTEQQRILAPKVALVMNEVANRIANDRNSVADALELARQALVNTGMQPDELFVVDADRLIEIDAQSKRAVVLMAAFLGDVRLIDNVVVELD